MRIVYLTNSFFCKMKAFTVLVLAVLAGTSGFLIKVPLSPIAQLDPVLVPSGWIHVQKLVMALFENVCEVSPDPVICRLSEEFSLSISPSDFMDPDVLTKFQALKTGKGFLPKGQIFSEYNSVHTDELKIILEVMRNAKSFDTFYKVAAWARQNLNCGLYVNLIYLALENRRDTEKLTLPPPYELLPNYFIRKDIIIQGSSLLAGETFTLSEGVRDEGNAYTLDANYTANFYDNDDESKLAYFREDIGLNSFYFLTMLKNAPWLNENININSRYGEDMYHMMKQLVARYNLERYSNGMPELDNLSWDSLSDAPYDPMLVYSNGNEFIHRTSSVQLPENEDKALLQTIENNIATVVSHMRESGYNKTQILNHLMEILVTGERSYDTLARQLLGKALSNNGQPTVFEHYMTSLRDPMIWRLSKKITDLVDSGLKVLMPYTRNELFFPGVEVMSIEVKKMMTNFDNFEFDITDALKIGNGDMTFQVKIGQPRLSHKPFTVKINISSLVIQKGLVKIYIGPKMMPGEFTKSKNMFYLLDSFDINLKRGSNIVTRSSNDMNKFAPDFMSLKTIRKKVEDAQFGLESLPLNTVDLQIGFPERLIIPRGTPEGLPLQLFVFVAPYMKAPVGGAYSLSNMEFNTAVLSPLYPIDLVMDNSVLLDLPNALLKDLIVTHKGVSKVNNYGAAGSTKSWYDNNANGPPPRPNAFAKENEPNDLYVRTSGSDFFDGQQNDASFPKEKQNLKSGYDYSSRPKQPYDYTSKRPQYQKPDYLSKRIDYKALYNNKITEKSEEIKSDNSVLDNTLAIIDQDGHILEVNPIIKNYYDIDQNLDLHDDRMQNDDSSAKIKYNLLKSSVDPIKAVDQKYDYKDMRPKIVKPDYKKMYKVARKSTENPLNVDFENEIKKQSKKIDLKSKNEESNLGMMEVFKIYKKNKKVESNEIVNDKINDDVVVIEDIGNVNVYQVLQDNMNEDTSETFSSNMYRKEFSEDDKDSQRNEYIGIIKDDKNEEFLKVVPVTQITDPNTKSNSYYKYIMRVIHNSSDVENVNSEEA